MSCDLCKNFPKRTVQKLNDDLAEGRISVTDLAENYYISTALIEEHQKLCLQELPSRGYEIAEFLLRELKETADARKQEYELDPDSRSQAMTHYINLMREYRETMKLRESLMPSDELAKDVMNKIINPIVRMAVTVIVDETGKMRQALSAELGPEYYSRVDAAVRDALVRFAERLKSEATEIAGNLPEVINTNVRKRKEEESAIPDVDIEAKPEGKRVH